MEDSFFGKSGTIQNLMDFSKAYQGMQSSNAMDRLGSLGKMVASVIALFA